MTSQMRSAPENVSLECRTDMVSVVVPSFSRLDRLMQCLDSVVRSEPQPPGGIEVIVITSTYSDDEVAEIEKLGARVVRRDGTVWVSEARNIGAGAASGEYLLFLDDDNTLALDAIWHLYQSFLRWPETTVAGPVMYYGSVPLKIWCAGVSRSRVFMKTRLSTSLPIPTPERLESEDFPNCFMVRAKDFRNVHGFDVEDFPQHMEESDLARRLRAQKGGYAYCVTAAKDWHYIGASFARRLHMHDARRAFWIARGRTFFTAVYGDRLQWFAYVAIGQWALAAVYLGATVLQAPDRIAVTLAYLRGMLAGFKLGTQARRKARIGEPALTID